MRMERLFLAASCGMESLRTSCCPMRRTRTKRWAGNEHGWQTFRLHPELRYGEEVNLNRVGSPYVSPSLNGEWCRRVNERCEGEVASSSARRGVLGGWGRNTWGNVRAGHRFPCEDKISRSRRRFATAQNQSIRGAHNMDRRAVLTTEVSGTLVRLGKGDRMASRRM